MNRMTYANHVKEKYNKFLQYTQTKKFCILTGKEQKMVMDIGTDTGMIDTNACAVKSKFCAPDERILQRKDFTVLDGDKSG